MYQLIELHSLKTIFLTTALSPLGKIAFFNVCIVLIGTFFIANKIQADVFFQ